MTIQEEIREGIAIKLADMYGEAPWINVSDYTKCNYEILADEFLEYLNEKGVVIKSKRELPKMPENPTLGDCLIRRTQEDMLKAKFMQVEPLIGEK